MKATVVAVAAALAVTGTTVASGLAVHAAACHVRAGGALPDPACTPGVTNPMVTPATLRTTICKPGWTATIRPPTSVTGPEKAASMRRYGDKGSASRYEYDHLISLELGGAPNDTRNMWPEPHVVAGDQGSFAKDRVENRLKAEVCAGKVSLAVAQAAISSDWRAAP